MDNSSVSESQMLGLGVVDDQINQNICFEDGTALGTKRLHLDSESSVEIEVNSLSGYVIGKRIKTENTCDDESAEDLMGRASCDELGDDNGIMLNSTASEGISSATEDMTFPAEEESADEDANVLIHHMDIKEPLSFLKKSLEENHGINLEGYEFYLQDSTPSYCGYQCLCNTFPIPEDTNLKFAILPCDSIVRLAGHKNLVEQCVQGCGTVQVNLQLKVENDGTKKINIVDVLKPSDSYLLASGNMAFSPDTPEEPIQPPVVEDDESDKNPIRWVVDNNFKANQLRLQIPQDPMEWDVSHVRHWLLWAVRQFNLTGIKLADWKITGDQLCNLSLEEFKQRVPYDPNDIFWTHLELLRRCQFVAVMQNPDDVAGVKENVTTKTNDIDKNIMRLKEKKAAARPVLLKPPAIIVDHVTTQSSFNRVSERHNGQVQLWQFLLDLLTDKEHRECIQWLGAEGEFKLIEPETVARLWGQRKNKPSMNYEKLSRALRYYYDGDMIAKVHGKRFVYKFVCDLKQLLGYSAFELNRLVIEAEMRAQNCANDPLQHSIFGSRQFL